MFLLLLISDKYSIVKIKFYKIELFGKIFSCHKSLMSLWSYRAEELLHVYKEKEACVK